MEIISANPLFGDQFATQKMEDLRQGQGIIDFVNSYAQVAVFHGLVGLSLFLGVIAISLRRTVKGVTNAMEVDPDHARLGIALLACLLATLAMMATTSFMLGYEKLYYILSSLGIAYGAGRITARAPTTP